MTTRKKSSKKTTNKPHKECLTQDLHKAAVFIIDTPHKLVAQNYKVVVYGKNTEDIPIWCRIVGNEQKADAILAQWKRELYFSSKI